MIKATLTLDVQQYEGDELEAVLNLLKALPGGIELVVKTPNAEKLALWAKLDLRVDRIGLPKRARNCLRNKGCYFIGDFINKTERELFRTRNFGRKSLWEIKDALAKLGLQLLAHDDLPKLDLQGWTPPPRE